MVDQLDSKYSDFTYSRSLQGAYKLLAAFAAVFVIYGVLTRSFPTLAFRAGVVLLFVIIVYARYPLLERDPSAKWALVVDLALVLLTIASFGYVLVNHSTIVNRSGIVYPFEQVIGGMAILLVLEATRRSIGAILSVLIGVFVLYAFAGAGLPGALRHAPISLSRYVSQTFLTSSGLFGLPLRVMITFVFLFILFGVLLEKAGGDKFFIQTANAIVGSRKGGVGNAAVLSSAFMGMLSGSAVANTATTGAITIPMMSDRGYDDEIAGGIEAAASTGGQFLPPVMGAAAFLMIAFTGESYLTIIAAAILPAILYFVAVLMAVQMYARAFDVDSMDASELPSLRDVLPKVYFLLPIPVLLVMLQQGYSIVLSATVMVAATLLITPLSVPLLDLPGVVFEALYKSADRVAGIFVASSAIGLALVSMSITALGLTLSDLIINTSFGILWLTAILTFLIAIVFGMGMPTSMIYILLATMVAPALVDLGVPVLAAHLFIFYGGMVSMVTPPVCFAAYAAAGISGANAMRTGIEAWKLALPGFIVPFFWVFNPSLILWSDATPVVFVIALFATILVAIGATGYVGSKPLPALGRIFFVAAAIALIVPLVPVRLVVAVLSIAAIAYYAPVEYEGLQKYVGARF